MLALWGLLWFASQLYLENLWVLGDSKVLIEHLNKDSNLAPGYLMTWLERINNLRASFSNIKFLHIFWEKNVQADRLSKKGLTREFGIMHYELVDAEGQGVVGSMLFS